MRSKFFLHGRINAIELSLRRTLIRSVCYATKYNSLCELWYKNINNAALQEIKSYSIIITTFKMLMGL